MTGNAAGGPETPPRTGVFGRVEEVSVTLCYRGSEDAAPSEAFLLTVALPEDEPQDGWDDARYLEVVEDVLGADGDAPPPYRVTADRTYDTWGRPCALARITASIELAPAPVLPDEEQLRWAPVPRLPGRLSGGVTVSSAVRLAVERAFRRLLAPPGAARHAIAHHEALDRARSTVTGLWDVTAAQLDISDEQHHPATGAWSLGLVDRARNRYDVVVGFVDGDPAAVHVRYSRAPEVVDSVGV